MNCVESLERDVLDCGVPLPDARAVGKRYGRALQSGSHADWIEFYVGMFVTLLRASNRTRTAGSQASQRLLQLLEDDLGRQLFDREAFLRVQLALTHRAA